MPVVEENQALRASTYTRPLNYTFDQSLRGGQGGFHYVFNEGGLTCSEPAEQYLDVCLVAPNEMENSIYRDRPSFVYLDCGAWVDNADGNNTRRRDFGLVCGPHVYLCEYVQSAQVPTSSVASVQDLFNQLAQQGCSVRVLAYNRAVNLDSHTPDDPSLYLFLPDFHMPPVTWFYTGAEVSTHVMIGPHYNLPNHLANLAVFQRQPNFFYRNIYSLARLFREEGASRVASGPIMGNPDIFRLAGQDLVIFLNALANLDQRIKRLLHIIHVGDMFELWLGRDYQFQPGDHDPTFVEGGMNRVADWALEVIIQHTPVFDALWNLERAGLAEIKYIWGNHDAYMKSQRVTSQLGLRPRDPTYTGLNGDLFVEHGHRFDRSNHDNVSSWSGPAGANAAFYMPVIRSAEPLARTITGLGHPEERDCYLLGATLIYLWQRYDRGVKPFSIYVMGHTHSRQLFTYNIRTQYHLYEIP